MKNYELWRKYILNYTHERLKGNYFFFSNKNKNIKHTFLIIIKILLKVKNLYIYYIQNKIYNSKQIIFLYKKNTISINY